MSPTGSTSSPLGLSSTLSSPATAGTEDAIAGGESGECQLLGKAAIFVQGALGALALLSLVYKRWRERPQRPIKIWFFDVSKQTTIGIPILILLLRLLTYGFARSPLGNPPESVESGNYGQPPRATWWVKQSIIYFIGLLGMKAFIKEHRSAEHEPLLQEDEEDEHTCQTQNEGNRIRESEDDEDSELDFGDEAEQAKVEGLTKGSRLGGNSLSQA
ncbi:MAG: hypothetical protein LQ342_001521 [Letrouitia transgressa]|nr:MAG: hypothetical protein LQ342_001521 [Letrouitia transgressa]